jgi:hypothetical protein
VTPGETFGTLYTSGVGTNKTKQHICLLVLPRQVTVPHVIERPLLTSELPERQSSQGHTHTRQQRLGAHTGPAHADGYMLTTVNERMPIGRDAHTHTHTGIGTYKVVAVRAWSVRGRCMVARDAATVLSLASRSQTRGRGTAERQQVMNGKGGGGGRLYGGLVCSSLS